MSRTNTAHFERLQDAYLRAEARAEVTAARAAAPGATPEEGRAADAADYAADRAYGAYMEARFRYTPMRGART